MIPSNSFQDNQDSFSDNFFRLLPVFVSHTPLLWVNKPFFSTARTVRPCCNMTYVINPETMNSSRHGRCASLHDASILCEVIAKSAAMMLLSSRNKEVNFPVYKALRCFESDVPISALLLFQHSVHMGDVSGL